MRARDNFREAAYKGQARMLAVPRRFDHHLSTVTTPRLVLAPLDAQDGHDLWSAVEQSREALAPWLPWLAFNNDEEASFRFAEASAQDWDGLRACRFAVRERKTRKFLGVVGLEALAHLHRNADLGYWLRTSATKSGFMTEAASFALQWAFESLSLHRIRVAAATDNHASLAVIRRLGFRFEGVARQAEFCDGRWLDHAVFGMLSGELVRPPVPRLKAAP